MALVNHAKREINAKIVFCGAADAGKSTLLKAICSQLPDKSRGQLKSISFQQDRMLFFDFTHPDGKDPAAYSLRIHLYTLTGEVTQENAWKMILKGVDGVAFVADSDPLHQLDHSQAFDHFQESLKANGKRITDLPAVIICTKQDLPEAVTVDKLCSCLPVQALPVFSLNPLSGAAVLNPICELLNGIISNLEDLSLPLQASVHDFCRVVPVPPSETKPETSIPESPVVADLQPDLDTPSITLDGVPEISCDGSLTVGIKVVCCGKISRAAMNISIINLPGN